MYIFRITEAALGPGQRFPLYLAHDVIFNTNYISIREQWLRDKLWMVR